MAKLLAFLRKKKKEIQIVLAKELQEDDSAVWIGEGTEKEYEEQQIADKGLKGIFGIK